MFRRKAHLSRRWLAKAPSRTRRADSTQRNGKTPRSGRDGHGDRLALLPPAAIAAARAGGWWHAAGLDA
eukprot:scaffold127546_cov63-Phaeocystis_antarctica.AAC.2